MRSTVYLAKLVLRDMAATGSGRVAVHVVGRGDDARLVSDGLPRVQIFHPVVRQALRDELRDTDVSVTSLVPGPTKTNFFRRAGMEDTRVGRMPKDDPGRVAKHGYDALMGGKQKVVAESLLSKAMAVGSNRFLPDSVKAKASRLISVPSGRR